jgi:DNA mismatch repair protein MutL
MTSPAAPQSAIDNRQSTIHVLPPDVAARIAAGEVIERPVSVVRELLDNAIDAGARHISVEIEDGGLALIRVVDDGRGIPPEQVELAFERHATSKISALGDLAHVHTLGFRGEALPSIAAAGDVELITRSVSEPVGVHLTLVDAQVARRSARAAPAGTVFAVRDLFARLPARRKFLSTPASESRQVTVLVSHYALAYPRIAFTLSVGGRRALSTGGDSVLRHAFAAVYGAATAAEMLAVSHQLDGTVVTGLAGPPGVHRGNRSGISIFINGRWVQSRPLVFAVVDAYQSQLPIGRHPVAALTITVPDEDVDVNVHPAKAEVRFRDERMVGRAVRQAVSLALDASHAAIFAPPGFGANPVDMLRVPGMPSLRQRLGVSPPALRAPAPLQTQIEWPSGSSPGPVAPVSPARPTQREVLPLLRVVGQMGATYIVCEGPDGMYLLDQHAAHERVVYDRIVARAADPAAPPLQPLLEPALAELDVPQAATLEEHRAHLESLGLALEPFGETAYLVRTIPVGLGGTDVVAAIRALLDRLGNERRVSDPFGRAASTVACHASVRAGMALAMDEMRALVADLEKTATPRTCPHGRPTLVHVSTDLLERQFGRR